MSPRLPLVLMILDGWGYRKEKIHNAIAAAHTPQWDHWWQSQPHILLEASGVNVGLPDQQMGNSEVGHMHIGAGRIIEQDLTRINKAIECGEYATNSVFINSIEELKHNGKTLHIIGLLSPGGIHSHEKHLFAFLDLCHKHQFSSVDLHLILDGRDTPPQSALTSLERLNKHLLKYPAARICSISGRYFAMDRDQRWQRIEPVYRLLTEGFSEYQFKTALEAINAFYQQAINDEFIPPTQIGSHTKINDGDAVFFFNFRSDRARQLTEALTSPHDFNGFFRKKTPSISRFITMTQYAPSLPVDCAFPPLILKNTLGDMIEDHGMTQLRIAETEKYAHVTFFLNGGTEQALAHESRLLIPSPQVTTYDLQPEMSAPQLTQALVNAIMSQQYDVIICNYANADMVGHTGNFTATVQAIECLDKAMSIVWLALSKINGQLLITADHGNAESMFDDAINQAHTAHTSQPVPLLYVGSNYHFTASQGTLTDIAPTILSLLNISIPDEMTGTPLLEPSK